MQNQETGPGTIRSETQRRRRRAAAWILAWLIAAVTLPVMLMLVSPPTRLALRTLVLLPSFFASLPGDPVDWFSDTPVHEVVDLQSVDGYVKAHVYRPPHGQHAALVISLGLDPAPPDDPRIVRLLDGLSRSGLVAVLIQSEALDNDRLFPDLPAALVEGVLFAGQQPYVRADRVGLFGFSVGGSLALIAANDPAISGRLRLVEAFGAYAQLDDAVLSVATRTLDDDSRIRRWQPLDEAERHLANALISGLANQDEAELLRSRFVAGDQGAIEPGQLSSEGRAVYELLLTRDRQAGRQLLDALPPLTEEDIRALSPLALVPRLQARLFVMYDSDDPLLPFTGSRQICRVASRAGLRPYCSRFSIFQHVDPTRGGNPVTVGHDLVELYLHAFAILRRLQ